MFAHAGMQSSDSNNSSGRLVSEHTKKLSLINFY